MTLPQSFSEPVLDIVAQIPELERRRDEVVFLTQYEDGAAALRDWGLLAVARPPGGLWKVETLRLLLDRDVALFHPDPGGWRTWTERDRNVLAPTVRRLGLLIPAGCPGREVDGLCDVGRYIARQKALGLGPQGLVEEALGCLEDPMPKVAPPDPAADWPPLRIAERPAVEPFPVEVLPPPVADFVHEVSDAIGCPVDFIGLPVLITAGAAIGRSASLCLKPGYFVSPALYGMNVGGPSSGKTPALRAATQPLWEIDRRLHEDYQREREQWERARQAAKEAHANPPPPPIYRSAVLEDCTVEAVSSHLAKNPRGLLVARDEGAAWVTSLNQYKSGGKGADRQFWLSALFGAAIRVDRKSNPDLVALRVPHPFLAVVGNLPPDLLGQLRDRGGRSDGFIERILFAFPDPLPRPPWSERGVSEEAQAEWSALVERLRARPLTTGADGDERPQIVALSMEAKEEWIAWYDAHIETVNAPGCDVTEASVDGKLCDFAGRLALVLHLLQLACDPTRGDFDPIPPVDRGVVQGAIRLWSYFRTHHRRARWHIHGGTTSSVASAVLDWLKRRGCEDFSVKELTDHLRWLSSRPGEPEAALSLLESQGAIRRRAEISPAGPRRGRKPAAVFDVHPRLLAR